MYIVHVASELAPIAKVGGLGDVIYGLSKELVRLNHQVEIIIPKYDCVEYSQLNDLKVEHRELWSFDGPYRYNNTVWSAHVDGLKVLLIESHHPDYFFSRGIIYGCVDDINRFTYFSRVAMEYLFKADKHPDVIHAHDWPAALVPILYKEMYRALGYRTGGTVLTIHNLEHQGKCLPSQLTKVGLRAELYVTSEILQDPSLPGHINILKGGIEYADQVTTVSPNYEREIKTPEGGCGLHEVLLKNQKKLRGILNGIDTEFWNPQTDIHLIQKYNTDQVNTKEQLTAILPAKRENHKQVRTHLCLQECDKPIIACVTRLVPQKGPELIRAALVRTLEKGGQFILLGATQIPEIYRSFHELQAHYKNHPHAKILLDQDEALAHLIYAATDMCIIPSLFEPCGLTQMISLRYGTVPLVRVTGGLADTVFDIDTSSRPIEQRNGFTFEFPDAKGIHWVVDRAIDCYEKNPEKWSSLLMNGIKMDFSWKRAAPEYLSTYAKLNQTNSRKESSKNKKER
jgi:starch synthase